MISHDNQFQLITPQVRDWDRFWKGQKTQKSDPSWSKRRILDILQPYVRGGKKILDAGCGSGFFSKYFCDQNMDTCSLDYSDSALQITRQVTGGRSKIIKDNMLLPNLKERVPQSFDLIFTDGLFEHFTAPDQDKLMENLLSVLNSGGALITFVPNRWSPWELIRPFFMPGIQERPFVLNELVELNSRHHLTIEQKGGINTLPFSFSPDRALGSLFGMLLYTISEKNDN